MARNFNEATVVEESDFEITSHLTWRLERVTNSGINSGYERGLKDLLSPDSILSEIPTNEGHDELHDDTRSLLREFYRRVVGAAVEQYGVEILPEAVQVSP